MGQLLNPLVCRVWQSGGAGETVRAWLTDKEDWRKDADDADYRALPVAGSAGRLTEDWRELSGGVPP
jgi:hypothetical protein